MLGANPNLHINGWIAQLVEQETENLRVDGSIPPLTTKCIQMYLLS